MYLTNLEAGYTRIKFKLEVTSTDGDDFIGWVAGFDAGDSTDSAAEWILFSWKQSAQTQFGGTGPEGLYMHRVTGQ